MSQRLLGVELVNPDMSKSVIVATHSKTLPTPALDQPAGGTHSPLRSTVSRCKSAFGLDPTGAGGANIDERGVDRCF